MFRRLPFLSLAGVVWALAGTPAQAQHPNHPLGFASDRAYQGGSSEVDTVDLFSGTLSLSLPIGPFTLSYNSNIWRYEVTLDGSGNQVISAQPDREMAAGLGWHLGLGQLYAPGHWYNPSSQWLYVDPTHGRHYFYDDLHRGENDGDAGVFYTRDNTYLRLKKLNNFEYDLEFPNGTVQRFANETGGPGTTYRLRKSWDPFGSASSPDLTVDYQVSAKDPNVETWELTDRWGNVQRINTLTNQTWMNRLVTSVDVPGVGGARVLYNFVYRSVLVSVSCKDNNPATADRITIPHLERIDLPDGTSYKMTDAANTLTYYNVCESGIEDVPGVLKGLQLPTGGRIAWTFQEYEFPPGGTNSPFYTSAGVATRTLQKGDGTALGTWRYRTVDIAATETEDPEVWLDLVFPTGDCTRHFFNARYWQTPSQGRGWEYGLPFSYRESSNGKYLSNQVWTSNDGAGGCSGTKLRSNYLRFRRDVTPGSGTAPASEWYQTNRVPEASRVVFHDDANRWIDTESSEFDGLGHFRFTTTTGNLFDDPVNQERRNARVNYDKVAGTYPGSFVPPATTAPWILGTFTYAERFEPGARGETVSRVEYGFDSATGALNCERVIASGAARTNRDILRIYTRDSRGRTSEERIWGGDLQTLPTTGPLCTVPAVGPEQWVQHEFEGEHHVRTRPIQSNGVAGAFLTFDVTLDAATGLVLSSRDPAGLAINYVYDTLGRLLETQPQGAAKQVFTYTAPAAGTGGSITSRLTSSSGAELEYQEQRLDEFGRPVLVRQKLPSGAFSDQATEYNSRGWVVAVSEWGFPTKKTEYLNYDPFGRARTIRPPEGSSHDVYIAFLGARRVTTSRFTATLPSAEELVELTNDYDSHGRLRTAYEGSATGTNVATTVEYDVGRRQTRVTSGFGTAAQVREATFDNRGFLLSEKHPELGASGNGLVFHFNYNSRGQATRLQDGARDLSFTFDYLGRATSIRDVARGNRLTSEFAYDGPVGYGKGRLWTAIQHNYFDLPWTAQGEEDVQVRDLFLYDVEGRGDVTRHQIQYSWGAIALPFTERFTYNESGRLGTHTLFQCLATSCTGTPAGNQPTRQHTYTRGELTSITNWVSNISYHASGAWHELVHWPGAKDVQLLDASNPSRPSRRQTFDLNNDLLFDTGTMLFDGAGSPKQLEGRSLLYDRAGRLAQERWSADEWQSYSYDVFGNLLAKTVTQVGADPLTTNLGIQSATNRLAAGTYDAAGNLRALNGITYDYNQDNRLTAVGVARYLYNAFGERAAEFFVDSGWNGFRFFLRGSENQLVNEMTWTHETGVITRTWDYTWAKGQLIARSSPTGYAEHYHLDGPGSVRIITDGAFFRKDLVFGPYGEDRWQDSVGNRFAFAGHERDFIARLDNMHARHYDSAKGRFLSVDPVQGSPGRPQSLNRYSYADGNPIAVNDPDGRQEKMSEMTDLRESIAYAIAHRQCETYAYTPCTVVSHTTTQIARIIATQGFVLMRVTQHTAPLAGGAKGAGLFGAGYLGDAAKDMSRKGWDGYRFDPNKHAATGYFTMSLGTLDSFKTNKGRVAGGALQGAAALGLDEVESRFAIYWGSHVVTYDPKQEVYFLTDRVTGKQSLLMNDSIDVIHREKPSTPIPETVPTIPRVALPRLKEKTATVVIDNREFGRASHAVWSLRTGRCLIDPSTCSIRGGGVGGAGFITVQFY